MKVKNKRFNSKYLVYKQTKMKVKAIKRNRTKQRKDQGSLVVCFKVKETRKNQFRIELKYRQKSNQNSMNPQIKTTLSKLRVLLIENKSKKKLWSIK